ncbi:MAG: flagellar motor switch protein FliG [Planctomycetota bacterium]|jgi:flagellar motor switch protein FliG
MPLQPGQPLPTDPDKLDGVVKAAIVLLSLDHDVAGELLKHLPTEMVEEVTRALASLQDVPPELTERIVEEFYSLGMATVHSKQGGLQYAKTLLRDSLDTGIADKVISTIQTQVQRSPFAFLQKAASDNLLTFIQDEHPQTIALIICHLPHNKASEVLVGLPADKQVEVVRRVANMEQTSPEVVAEVESGLESRLSSMLVASMDKVGGVSTTAEILNLCDRSTEKTILEGIESDDPDLVESIRRLMFVFEDILKVNDKGIQAVLKEVDNEELCLALKTASEELKEKIFSNMSARAATLIREDMEYMGPVRLSDVEGAQQRIVDVVRRLEEAGEIIISGRGDKDIIV